MTIILDMKLSISLFATLAILNLFTACVSNRPHAKFTKTINFSSLDTFSFKHTLVTGMDFRESEELLLEDLSEQTITSELLSRGFELADMDADADFYAVVKWKKAVSSYADPFDHIDPYSQVTARQNEHARRFASRLHLTLEMYESSSRNLFWRNDLPNIFDALQLTEGRIVDSLKLAIKDFPPHIEKDPNLPNIE